MKPSSRHKGLLANVYAIEQTGEVSIEFAVTVGKDAIFALKTSLAKMGVASTVTNTGGKIAIKGKFNPAQTNSEPADIELVINALQPKLAHILKAVGYETFWGQGGGGIGDFGFEVTGHKRSATESKKLTVTQLRRLIAETIRLQEKGPLPRIARGGFVGSAAISHGDIADKITNEIMGHLDIEMINQNEKHAAIETAQDSIYDHVTDLVIKLEDELESKGIRINWSK